MLTFFLFMLARVGFSFGGYCNTDECPGYSIISSWTVTFVDFKSIEFEWDFRGDYKDQIFGFEVHWLSAKNCTKCNGKTEVFNRTALKIDVSPCVNYTIEIYPLNATKEHIRAPGIFSQVTASEALKNGSALIVDRNWAVLRWLEKQSCLNSSYIAICHGPNTVSHVIEESLQGVVLVNVSGLMEKSDYVCGAYTVNPAGSSIPSEPVFFTTAKIPRTLKVEKAKNFVYSIPLAILILLILLSTLFMCFLNQILQFLPWRGSYSVNSIQERDEF